MHTYIYTDINTYIPTCECGEVVFVNTAAERAKGRAVRDVVRFASRL